MIGTVHAHWVSVREYGSTAPWTKHGRPENMTKFDFAARVRAKPCPMRLGSHVVIHPQSIGQFTLIEMCNLQRQSVGQSESRNIGR